MAWVMLVTLKRSNYATVVMGMVCMFLQEYIETEYFLMADSYQLEKKNENLDPRRNNL